MSSKKYFNQKFEDIYIFLIFKKKNLNKIFKANKENIKPILSKSANRIIVVRNINNANLETTSKTENNICKSEKVKIICYNEGECVPLSEIDSIGFKCLCKTNFTGLLCETSITIFFIQS